MLPTPRLLFVILSALAAGSARAESGWVHTTWNGEDAWSSEHGDQAAIVSVARERVIYLGTADGKNNFLSAPEKRVEPSAKEPSPNWGGHRFWLGPQSRWGWPPPVEWEHAGAVSAEVHGTILTLKEHQDNTAYPALERDYAWDGDRLSCTGRWRGTDRLYYAMHVVAVDAPITVEPELLAWEHVPLGLVGIHLDHPDVANPVPNPAVNLQKGRASIRSGVGMVKLGFYPQTLHLDRPKGQLLVAPGPIHGTALESPDFGYTTQVWVAPAFNNFAELEQITPFILPAEDGWCGSTIFLRAELGKN